jgi:hypothetical protein
MQPVLPDHPRLHKQYPCYTSIELSAHPSMAHSMVARRSPTEVGRSLTYCTITVFQMCMKFTTIRVALHEVTDKVLTATRTAGDNNQAPQRRLPPHQRSLTPEDITSKSITGGDFSASISRSPGEVPGHRLPLATRRAPPQTDIVRFCLLRGHAVAMTETA